MKITIVGKGYNVSDRLKNVIESKAEKFDKYFDDTAEIKVVCKEEHAKKYTMEMTIIFDSQIVRAEVTSDNMYHNIDLAMPKIERQVRKYKTKLAKKVKQGAFSQDALYSQEIKEEIPKVVKKKVYELMIMDVQDAIAEMELLDNNFYIFINNKTERVNVIYRRKDGDAGLIELEY